MVPREHWNLLDADIMRWRHTGDDEQDAELLERNLLSQAAAGIAALAGEQDAHAAGRKQARPRR